MLEKELEKEVERTAMSLSVLRAFALDKEKFDRYVKNLIKKEADRIYKKIKALLTTINILDMASVISLLGALIFAPGWFKLYIGFIIFDRLSIEGRSYAYKVFLEEVSKMRDNLYSKVRDYVEREGSDSSGEGSTDMEVKRGDNKAKRVQRRKNTRKSKRRSKRS